MGFKAILCLLSLGFLSISHRIRETNLFVEESTLMVQAYTKDKGFISGTGSLVHVILAESIESQQQLLNGITHQSIAVTPPHTPPVCQTLRSLDIISFICSQFHKKKDFVKRILIKTLKTCKRLSVYRYVCTYVCLVIACRFNTHCTPEPSVFSLSGHFRVASVYLQTFIDNMRNCDVRRKQMAIKSSHIITL